MDWFSLGRGSKRRPTTLRPRATRFPVESVVQFRGPDDTHWQRGTTENMSCTGLLLRSEHTLEPSTPVVLEMPAPKPLCGEARVRLVAEGRVVRMAPNGRNGNALAVSIGSLYLPDHQPPDTATHRSTAQLRIALEDLNRQLAIVVGNADLLLTVSGLDTGVVRRLREVKRAAMQAAAAVRKLPM